MAFGRYLRDAVAADGKGLTAPGGLAAVRAAIKRGDVPIVQTFTTTDADRLDSIAGRLYGDSRYWWVVAAASNIGWALQVPPGTIIKIVDLRAIERIVG
jgi:hypothetical protein